MIVVRDAASVLVHLRTAVTGATASKKVGRVRTCRLGLRGLEEEAAWIEGRRQIWNARFDALDEVVEALKQKEKVDGRQSE